MSSRIFRIDAVSRTVDELVPTTFSGEGFLETKDIHEWLVSHPRILGEDLLIIQREHVGVLGSRRRPDILAIDRDGNLVVIEAKRDDSGTDIYWQAALYAASYWPRSGTEIVDLYSTYAGIDKDDAIQRLVKHTESEDEQDLLNRLNKKQRVILVARSFPKEVTTTVLWLNQQGLDISCLQLTPYPDRKTGTYYIQSTYVIPVLETKELMVELRKTQQEREAVETNVTNRQNDEVSSFMRGVFDQLRERLAPELMPNRWSRWAGMEGTIRYFKLWYTKWPWRNHYFCFSLELETGEQKPHSGAVFVNFYTWVPYLKTEGISEDMVASLRRITQEISNQEGLETKQHEASFLAGKWIAMDGLSSTAIDKVADAVAWLIKLFVPRLQLILDTIENAPPAAAGSNEEAVLNI